MKPPVLRPKPRKRREITAEDRQLWHHVTRQAKPLPGRKAEPEPLILPELAGEASPATPVEPPRRIEPKPRPHPPLVGIERRLRRDIARGSQPIDFRIDLHGMRQAEAHSALLTLIHRAHHSGAKLVLVITGKGGAERDGERGILRRLVPHWLADPAVRRLIVGFEAASPGHGGEGALYVRIRRDRVRQP